MCSNITINDDIFVEGNEHFMVFLDTDNTDFSAGVEYFRQNTTIEISDNDGSYMFALLKPQ